MSRGRPPLGADLVDRLEGPDDAKLRLKLILETLAGTKSVCEACRELGVGEARFHQIRELSLEAALGRLAPRPSGRPRRVAVAGGGDVHALEQRVEELEMELQAARIRTEIAVLMPQLLRDPSKKNAAKRDPSRRLPSQRRREPPCVTSEDT